MLRLWLTRLGQGRDEPVPPLSEYRARKLETVRNAELRAQMLSAERLLVAALAAFGVEPPLDIVTGEQGKPRLRNGALCFSLSHSGAFAACAVSDGELGLDIQTPEELREGLVRRFFTEEERRSLRESERPDADFTALWCCKESYLKALGTGLHTPLNSFSVALSDPPTLEGNDSVNFWLWRDTRFTLAVCALDGRGAEPETVEWI